MIAIYLFINPPNIHEELPPHPTPFKGSEGQIHCPYGEDRRWEGGETEKNKGNEKECALKKTQAASEVTEGREPFCIRSAYLRKGYLTAASKVPKSKLC